MNLEENFIEYKNITISITETVKGEEYEQLEEKFQQRQLILDDINKYNYSKQELKRFYLKFELESLDKLLASHMKVKRKSLLKKIGQNKKKQSAIKGYNNLSAKAVYLSKEV